MDPSDAVSRLLDLHNQQRARAGLAPLELDTQLSAAALIQASDCARRDRLTHRGADGSGPGDRMRREGADWSRCAENAAQQPRPPAGWPGEDPRTPEWAMTGWMKSRGHRANLLGPYSRMGAAFADSARGSRYWVVDFATPSGGTGSPSRGSPSHPDNDPAPEHLEREFLRETLSNPATSNRN